MTHDVLSALSLKPVRQFKNAVALGFVIVIMVSINENINKY